MVFQNDTTLIFSWLPIFLKMLKNLNESCFVNIHLYKGYKQCTHFNDLQNRAIHIWYDCTGVNSRFSGEKNNLNIIPKT